MSGPDGFNEWFEPFGGLLGAQIRQAVQDIDGGIEPREQLRDLGLAFGVARESQIDGGPIQHAAEYGGVRHAGPGGAAALHDRRAIEQNRLAPGVAVRRWFEEGAGRQADLDRFNAIVERQIQQVLTFLLLEPLGQQSLV